MCSESAECRVEVRWSGERAWASDCAYRSVGHMAAERSWAGVQKWLFAKLREAMHREGFWGLELHGFHFWGHGPQF